MFDYPFPQSDAALPQTDALGTQPGAVIPQPDASGAQISGDVLHNPGLGNALALGMIVIMALSIAGYTWLQRRTARWLRS